MKTRTGYAIVSMLVWTAPALGCGGIDLGGLRPGGSTPAATTSEESGDFDAEWKGIYGSTFGRLVFKESGEHRFDGTYPGGTLTCTGAKLELTCEWKDNTGGGHAKFHWTNANFMAGTFGNGPSDSDQGEWNLTWPAPGAGMGPVELRNDCGHAVDYCKITSDGSKTFDSAAAGAVTTVNLSDGTTIAHRDDSACGDVIATIGSSTKTVKLCE